jgi:hypothetical protein
LQDKDRIFTNIYGEHDIFINGAMKRGDWYRCDHLVGATEGLHCVYRRGAALVCLPDTGNRNIHAPPLVGWGWGGRLLRSSVCPAILCSLKAVVPGPRTFFSRDVIGSLTR